MRRAVARQCQTQGFLGAGLADRAGDGDDFAGKARARGAGKLTQGFQYVVDEQERRVGEARALRARDHREAGAAFQRRLDEIVAVAGIALDGEEGLALADGAGVDGDAGHLGRQPARFLRPHGGGHGVEGPEGGHGIPRDSCPGCGAARSDALLTRDRFNSAA